MPGLQLAGLTVPVITPFHNDAKLGIDLKKLEKLIDYLIKVQKSDALVVIGTTGESTSLSHAEKETMIQKTVEMTNGCVPVIAGTGSANTEEAIEMTRFSEKVGASGVLVVSPYYIRPNQDGLYRHFLMVAQSTKLPIVLYNHPGRTGASIEIDTLLKLAKAADNIVAMKDCPNSLSASTDFARRVRAELGRPFAVLTGEDENIFVNLCLGADGAISATGHLVGAEIKEMMKAFHDGDLTKAREIQFSITDFQRLLFGIPSPAPIKACLDLLGTDLGGPVRPPLVDASPEFKEKLRAHMIRLNKLG